MSTKYPALLTFIMLSVAVVAAGAGVVVNSETSLGGGGSSGIIGGNSSGGLCTYSDVDSQSVVVDDVAEPAGGTEVQFAFTVPEDDAAVQINARQLTVTTAELAVSGPDGDVLFRVPVTEELTREIANARAGSYQIRIGGDNGTRSETGVEVRVGVC
jgi:hypothetical protein